MKYRVLQIKIRQCRVCGCTNYQACLGGCYWVEKELCSKCAEKLRLQQSLLAGEVEASHKMPMSEFYNLLSSSERKIFFVIDPESEYNVINDEKKNCEIKRKREFVK